MIKKDFEFNQQNFSANLPDDASESVWIEIFKEREYKAAELVIGNASGPILDVGAHVGLFEIYVRSLNKTVPIFAIEPEEVNFKTLEENIKGNKLTKIKTFQMALGGRTESGRLVVSSDSHNHRLESAPVSGEPVEEGDTQANQPIEILSLRDFLDKEKIATVSLLKMDIEGGEYDVFSACMPADFVRIKYVIMEYHNYGGLHYKVLETQLRENGFGVQIFPSKFDKRMGFIFARNKRV